MNTKDMNELVEGATKTLFYVVLKTAKSLMETGLGEDIAVAVATLQMETNMQAIKDELDAYPTDEFIKEWEDKNAK